MTFAEFPLRFVVLGLAAAWFLRESSGALVLGLLLFLYGVRERITPVLQTVLSAAFGTTLVLAVVWAVMDASSVYFIYKPDTITETEVWLRRLEAFNQIIPLLSLSMATLILWLMRISRGMNVLVLTISAAFMAISLSQWDVRSEPLRDLENGKYWNNGPFKRFLGAQDVVYWQDNVSLTWLLLGRSSYYSLSQAAGLVFSEPTAHELYRRALQIRPLGAGESVFTLLTGYDAFMRTFGEDYIEPGNLKGLIHLCQDPVLDHVVLDVRHKALVQAAWIMPLLSKTAYLYDCHVIRQADLKQK